MVKGFIDENNILTLYLQIRQISWSKLETNVQKFKHLETIKINKITLKESRSM